MIDVSTHASNVRCNASLLPASVHWQGTSLTCLIRPHPQHVAGHQPGGSCMNLPILPFDTVTLALCIRSLVASTMAPMLGQARTWRFLTDGMASGGHIATGTLLSDMFTLAGVCCRISLAVHAPPALRLYSSRFTASLWAHQLEGCGRWAGEGGGAQTILWSEPQRRSGIH